MAEHRQGRTPASPQCPQCALAPRNHLMSSSLARQPGPKVPRVEEQGESQGWVVRKEHGTVCPQRGAA